MITKIIIITAIGAFLLLALMQWKKRIINKNFRKNIEIGNECFVFTKVEHKEYKIKGRIKYINRDNHKAYFQCFVRPAQGWYSIDQLFVK